MFDYGYMKLLAKANLGRGLRAEGLLELSRFLPPPLMRFLLEVGELLVQRPVGEDDVRSQLHRR